MNTQKRGQLTLLVIIGLVLLLSVTLIISIQSALVQDQVRAQAQAAVSDFIQQNSIEQYVTSCLNNVAVEGLQLLTKQGGVIYDYQGGLTPTQSFAQGVHYLPFNTSSTVYNVSYAIGTTVYCPPDAYIRPMTVNLSDDNTSYYPVKNTYLEDFTLYYTYPYQSNFPGCNGINQRTSLLSGYLGSNAFPKLCSYNGSNAPNQDAVSCAFQFYDTPQEPFSLQRQLETYIKNNLNNCVNFSYYEQELANYNITVDNNRTRITSTLQNPRGILIQAEYPFVVQLPGEDAVYSAANFQVTLDVHLRRLYDFAYRVLFNQVRDPDFVLSRDYNTTTSWTPSLELERVEQACTTCFDPLSSYDDILVFRDQTAFLRGEPVTLQVAIKQRKPILEYLHDKGQANVYDDKLLNFLFLSNGTVQFSVNATDPDEDNLTYTYFGWKETYDTWFNYTKCLQESCTILNHTAYQVRLETEPKKLSSSPDYTTTKRSAGPIKTNESDIGYHEIQVLVTDEHGAQDFQTVRFLVFDVPVARIEGRNFYDDIDNRYASIEDLYELNGSGSTASVLFGGAGLSAYIFTDVLEGFYLNTTQSTVIVPISPDFTNITQAMFTKKGEHEIILTVRQEDTSGFSTISSIPAVLDVTVVDCLPHGYDASSPSSYSPLPDETNTPFASNYWNEADPFKQPNVCCQPISPIDPNNLGAGTIREPNEKCFDTSWLTNGYLSIFPLNDQAFYSNRANIDLTTGEVIPLEQSTYPTQYGSFNQDVFGGLDKQIRISNDQMNDIFNVTQIQYCSGNRGNSCGGELAVTWNAPPQYQCEDLSMPGQFARCSGPGMDSWFPMPLTGNDAGENLALETGTPICYNYTSGQSFEKFFLGVNEFNTYNTYSTSIAKQIAAGSCAPNATAAIDFTLSPVVIDTNAPPATEVFTCQATCGEGSCDYNGISTCSCNLQNECKGVSAQNFYQAGQERYYCTGSVACTSDCQAEQAIATAQITSKEGCQCLGKSAGTTFTTSWPVPTFFDKPYSYKLNNNAGATNQLCCNPALQNTLTTIGSQTGALTCVQGYPKTTGQIFNGAAPLNPNAVTDTLSCNGQLLFCGNGQLPVGAITATTGTQQCGHTCINTASGRKWQ